MWWMYPCSLVAALVLHELGHYAAARWYGVGIERAFLFLDANYRALWQRRIGGTVYGIGWLPIGAYVKLKGMDRLMNRWLGRPLVNTVSDPDDLGARPPEQIIHIVMAGGLVNMGCIALALALPHTGWTLPWCVCHALLLLYSMLGTKLSDHWCLSKLMDQHVNTLSFAHFWGVLFMLALQWITAAYVWSLAFGSLLH